MHWKLLSWKELKNHNTKWLLSRSSHPPWILLQDSNKISLLIQPPETKTEAEESPDDLPCLFCEVGDLNTIEFWQQLLAWHRIPEIDLARFASRHPRIDSAILMRAYGLRPHYKKQTEWEELAQLDDNSRELNLRYDFGINTLRLWNRLDIKERREWQQLFDKRNLKKNWIREIIHDYYDLASPLREQVRRQAQEFDWGWGESKARFPGEQIRNLVHEARSPQYYHLKKKATQLKKELQLPRQIQLEIPGDLELHEMELRIRFTNTAELQKNLDYLGQDTLMHRVNRLFELL